MNTNQLERKVRHLEERFEDQFRETAQKLRATASRAEELVREYPTASIATAFAIGFLVARAARRS